MSTITSPVTGTIWKIQVAVGDAVSEDDEVVILESMKMEIPVEAERSGTIAQILCVEGASVDEGATLMILE